MLVSLLHFTYLNIFLLVCFAVSVLQTGRCVIPYKDVNRGRVKVCVTSRTDCLELWARSTDDGKIKKKNWIVLHKNFLKWLKRNFGSFLRQQRIWFFLEYNLKTFSWHNECDCEGGLRDDSRADIIQLWEREQKHVLRVQEHSLRDEAH